MGYKSRGNWRTGLCLKFDCTNRDIKCTTCVRFSEYKTNDSEKQPDNNTV